MIVELKALYTENRPHRHRRRCQTAAAVWAMAGVLAISGCQVNQKKETATYRQYLSSRVAEQTYDGEKSLTLKQAIELANLHNEQLSLQGEQYLQALIDKDRAVARFLPTVAFAPVYTVQKETKLLGGLGPLGSSLVPAHTFDLPFEASLSTNIPGDIANTRRAANSAEAQRQLLLDLKATVELDVARVYYQILRSQRQAKVLQETAAVQQTRLHDAEVRYRAGAALPLDVSQARSQLASSEITLTHTGGDVRNGRALLALLMGVPQVNGELTDKVSVPAEVPDEQKLMDLASRQRNDLLAAQAEVQAATSAVQEAWSQYFPSVSLDFTYFAKRDSFPSDVNWMNVLQVKLPIFAAGLIHADVRTAYSQLRQAQLSESLVRRQILKNIRVAREDFVNSQQLVSQRSTEVEAADEALRQAAQAYRNGLVTQLERLVAQDQLLSAQLGLYAEELATKVYYLDLMRATGGQMEQALSYGEPLVSQSAGPNVVAPGASE